ncbi:5-(carboxyamino)imidazole ribonucleotide synthase [Arsenicicoccus sp. MKL-02]|uniref:N5-carboxyaminoimidazole ribonucleotide synthase n=1 Tax=Arsenicicoccus cauae TaxID=2663847 RepID=A0A6I3IKV7_9MICO|nr:5-(carboxyamino)imidazole ribonucleotide synthase [Arsenicicoccus cauae]MTB72325.1 5-(carboxyamino)imidazole ribonucleotide synthase [Arsenicicoccus cauae]
MTTPRTAPGGFPVVGIIGGGQLARMTAPPAVGLGVTLSVLAESESASAAQVIPSSPVGDHTSVEDVVEFARRCDVVTFDHEHVPPEVIAAVQAAGVRVEPSPEALLHAQDKLVMRRRLTELGIPCPDWAHVTSRSDLEAFGERVGWPLVLKTPRGGYDGKGVRVVTGPDDARDWLDAVEAAGAGGTDSEHGATMADGLLAEAMVGFTRELAVLVARSPSGQAAVWPVVETVQTDGICTEVLAPAPDLDPELASRASESALRIAGELGVTGVMAVELFETRDGDDRPTYLVNELAMRPHNSGHWTIDGSVTSQFEQHLRAVLDLPLGSTRARERWTVMGNVLGGDYPELYATYRHLMARDPAMKFHLYGKDVRPGRKIGHVDVSGDDLDDLRARARHACDYLQGVITE